jgi:hypothetical protein
VLDAFLKIAPSLYQRYGNRDDDAIKRELETMARGHFRAGLDALVY